MEPYQIIILVILLLLFLYVSGFLLIVSNSIGFRRRLRKRAVALMVLVSEKQEILLAWFELFAKEKIPLSEEDHALLSSLKSINLNKPTLAEWITSLNLLKNAQLRLGFLSEEADLQSSLAEKNAYVSTLHDLDANYRQSSAIYNADVGAFNYWISIPGFSWLLYLLGFRKKTLLN